MIRSIPFNFRNNAEKTRDTVERVVDFIMEQPLNPIGKVTGALASFRCDIRERRTGRCERSFAVDGIKWEESAASMENGILKVVLPKLGVEDIKKNSIEIK